MRDTGPESGIEGINRTEELVAKTREQIGDDVELMLDAWMSLNVEYTVRLVETLKPYRLKWLEDYVLPEDMESYAKVRQRVPGANSRNGRTLVHHPSLCHSRQSGACRYFANPIFSGQVVSRP